MASKTGNQNCFDQYRSPRGTRGGQHLPSTALPLTQVSASTSSRRLSASFSRVGLPTSEPTTACSSVIASKPRGSTLKSSTTLSQLPVPMSQASVDSAEDMSTTHTSTSISRPYIQQRATSFRGGLTRSCTFNVLSNITSSRPRKSISDPVASRLNLEHVGSDIFFPSPQIHPANSEVMGVPRGDNPLPDMVYKPQSPAYWSGRFMSLHDRFQNEMLQPQNLEVLVCTHGDRPELKQNRPPSPDAQKKKKQRNPSPASLPFVHLPNRSSKAANTQLPFQSLRRKPENDSKNRPQIPLGRDTTGAPQTNLSATTARPYCNHTRPQVLYLTDPIIRSRRVLLHLEATCVTDEARRSLHAWQTTYARRTGEEELLPPHTVMRPPSSHHHHYPHPHMPHFGHHHHHHHRNHHRHDGGNRGGGIAAANYADSLKNDNGDKGRHAKESSWVSRILHM